MFANGLNRLHPYWFANIAFTLLTLFLFSFSIVIRIIRVVLLHFFTSLCRTVLTSFYVICSVFFSPILLMLLSLLYILMLYVDETYSTLQTHTHTHILLLLIVIGALERKSTGFANVITRCRSVSYSENGNEVTQ